MSESVAFVQRVRPRKIVKNHFAAVSLSTPAPLAVTSFMQAKDDIAMKPKQVLPQLARVGAQAESGVVPIARGSMAPDRAIERERFVADATAALAESLDSDATLDTIARLIVPRLADLCIVDLCGEHRLVRAKLLHRDPVAFGELEALRGCAPELDADVPCAKAARTGEPTVVAAVTDAWMQAVATGDAHLAALRRSAVQSAMFVPMVASGRTVGVLTLLSSEPGRRYGEVDLTYAMLLAHRAAVALAHARMYEEAVRARRARDDLLAIVSHDLRGPLSVIQLSATALDRKSPSHESAAILRGVTRASVLIQDLLTMARLDAGQLPLERTREAVGAMIDEVVELYRPAAQEKGIALEAIVEPELPELFVDRRRMHQVLANLVGNALKFTPASGWIEARARRAGDLVVIEVSDSGVGIDAEGLEHAFDRYWQAAHARRAGAGLGLAIVKGIVDEHGGAVRITSELGKGTCVTIELPIAAA